ncbi:MAG: 30S ribosomal protein S6 [Candidatus Pacebacteria bacterium]|nr:30S ribosomal protein S6 [Candidatus Paceibacterota bacterium]
MTNYEMLVVLPGTMTEAEANPVIQTIKETVEKQGAKQLVVNDMGKSRLAYPMKHIRYGYYYILQFAAETQSIQEIQNRIRLISNILRMTLKTYDPATQTVDKTKLTITPLAAVVVQDDSREPSRDSRREAPKAAVVAPTPVVTEVADTKAKAVSMEEIEQKLDQILDKV